MKTVIILEPKKIPDSEFTSYGNYDTDRIEVQFDNDVIVLRDSVNDLRIARSEFQQLIEKMEKTND